MQRKRQVEKRIASGKTVMRCMRAIRTKINHTCYLPNDLPNGFIITLKF